MKSFRVHPISFLYTASAYTIHHPIAHTKPNIVENSFQEVKPAHLHHHRKPLIKCSLTLTHTTSAALSAIQQSKCPNPSNTARSYCPSSNFSLRVVYDISVASGVYTTFSPPEKKKIGMCCKRARLISSISGLDVVSVSSVDDESGGEVMTIPVVPIRTKWERATHRYSSLKKIGKHGVRF